MDSPLCLAWCRSFGSAFPDDRRTAEHVLDWLADRAEQAAMTPEDQQAVASARENARCILTFSPNATKQS